jgi:hypothetical protein
VLSAGGEGSGVSRARDAETRSAHQANSVVVLPAKKFRAAVGGAIVENNYLCSDRQVEHQLGDGVTQPLAFVLGDYNEGHFQDVYHPLRRSSGR